MDVVEHEYEGRRVRKQLEQRAHGAVASVALLLKGYRSPAPERGQRRQDVGKLCLYVVVERSELFPVEALDVLVERIDEDGERQVALELRP